MRPDKLIRSALRRVKTPRWHERERNSLSVGEVARLNTREAYDLIYRSEDLLAQYLEAGRLSFYEEVADYCAQLLAHHRRQACVRVVDVGCGTGQLLLSLWQRVAPKQSVELWGIDYAPSGIERAKKSLPESKFLVADIYISPLPSRHFDLVLCTETLEHLDAPDAALREMLRICARSGRAIITVPNGEIDHWDGHVNFWTESEFGEFLSPYGLCEITLIHDDRILRATLVNTK
jgi:SAM-dependent methyltransferase